jgi:hypothetical protein
MLENQDWNVGRVLQKLDELKLTDNTLVIYFSDNGPNGHRWTGGLKGKKGGTDEGGVKSVCFMKLPGTIPSGKSVPEIAGAIDLLPTLPSIAGVNRVGEKPLDGRDLTPLLSGNKTDWPDRMIFSAWPKKVSVRTQTHRLDANGKLYDMVADSGQTAPIDSKNPELSVKLKQAAEAWRNEVFNLPEDKDKKGDSRPLPIGGIKRSAAAPNSSYFVNWKTLEGKITWNSEVHTTGKYAVTVDYTCPLADAGSTIRLSFGDAQIDGKVTPGWDPPIKTNQDTVPRNPIESQMKDFKTLDLGEIELKAGVGDLTLTAIEIPGASVMEVRRVTLTLLK